MSAGEPSGAGLRPATWSRAAPFRPAARTATTTSPAPGSGSGCSRHSRAPSTIVTAYTRAVSGPLVDADVVALGQARVELARPDDLLLLLPQLDPVGQPEIGRASSRERGCHYV